MIDAKENHAVCVSDAPGKYLNTDMDDVVHVQLDGTLSKSLVKVNISLYCKYTITFLEKK